MSEEQQRPDDDVLEPSAVEEPPATRTTMAVEPVASTPASPTVTPQVGSEELVARLAVMKEAMDNAMKEGTDYGTIPGTDKPTLYKSGAEKLSVLFQLDIQPRPTKTWGPGDHLTVETAATVFHVPTGARVGYGEGICSTREKKYGKRKANLVCPVCKTENVRRSKKEAEFYCWQKIGGCGETFALNDERITGQDLGDVDNPDLPDTWNTVVKMAEKRARVDAVLAVTGASALFTQDLEDGDEKDVSGVALPPATEEQKGRLNKALLYLLPEVEAERVWGLLKTLTEGTLTGPIAEAALLPIKARADIEKDTAATDEEAEADERAQAESGVSAEEKREKEARAKAGKKRSK